MKTFAFGPKLVDAHGFISIVRGATSAVPRYLFVTEPDVAQLSLRFIVGDLVVSPRNHDYVPASVYRLSDHSDLIRSWFTCPAEERAPLAEALARWSVAPSGDVHELAAVYRSLEHAHWRVDFHNRSDQPKWAGAVVLATDSVARETDPV